MILGYIVFLLGGLLLIFLPQKEQELLKYSWKVQIFHLHSIKIFPYIIIQLFKEHEAFGGGAMYICVFFVRIVAI